VEKNINILQLANFSFLALQEKAAMGCAGWGCTQKQQFSNRRTNYPSRELECGVETWVSRKQVLKSIHHFTSIDW